MTKVTPFLMFNDQLEAAIAFYTTTFPDSEIRNVARTGEDGPVTSADFVIGGQSFMGFNGGPVLGVSRDTVIRWIEHGLLRGSQVTPGAPWRVQVTEQDRQRLTAADAPEGWLPLKGAARALGVSQQTVVQQLKSGRLEGVRVRVGRRSSWRIRVPSTTCDDQPALFNQQRP